jgi:hypothetical protein
MWRWRQLREALLADRKKLSIMASLLAVALLLWGRVLLKRVPRTAVASPPAAAAVEGSPRDANREESINHINKTVYVDLASVLSRDLFAIDSSRFAQIPLSPVDSITQEKSRPQSADEQGMAQVVSSLRLQSTVLGPQPRAVIDGVSVTAGQEFKGFLIKEIQQRQVIVERNGMIFLLKM